MGLSRLANKVVDEEEGNETVIRVKDKPEISDIQSDDSSK